MRPGALKDGLVAAPVVTRALRIHRVEVVLAFREVTRAQGLSPHSTVSALRPREQVRKEGAGVGEAPATYVPSKRNRAPVGPSDSLSGPPRGLQLLSKRSRSVHRASRPEH